MRPLPDMNDLLSSYYREGRCPRSIEVPGYAAGELGEAGRHAFEDHLVTCTECREILDLASTHRASWEAAGVERTDHRQGWFGRPVLLWSAAAAAVVVAVLLVALLLPSWQQRPGDDRLLIKGAWQLHVAASRDGNTFLVQDGTRLLPGDRLGFFYTAARPGFLYILYVDEQGGIARLYPSLEDTAVPVAAGSEVPLPDGAVASPGVGCEWVIGMYSPRPFEGERARAIAQRLWESRTACVLDQAAAAETEIDSQIVWVIR